MDAANLLTRLFVRVTADLYGWLAGIEPIPTWTVTLLVTIALILVFGLLRHAERASTPPFPNMGGPYGRAEIPFFGGCSVLAILTTLLLGSCACLTLQLLSALYF